MNINEIENMIKKYDFLMSNPHLGKNIILLGLDGSYAYGTNVEGSDIDIRGCALNSKSEILTNELLKMTDFIFKSKYKEDVL